MNSRSPRFSTSQQWRTPTKKRGSLPVRNKPKTTDLTISLQCSIAAQMVQNDIDCDSPIVRRLAQADDVLAAAGKGAPKEARAIKNIFGDATDQALCSPPAGWKTSDQVAKRFILNIAAKMVADFAVDKIQHLQPLAQDFFDKLFEAFLQ